MRYMTKSELNGLNDKRLVRVLQEARECNRVWLNHHTKRPSKSSEGAYNQSKGYLELIMEVLKDRGHIKRL